MPHFDGSCDCTMCNFAEAEIARICGPERTCDGCGALWGYCECEDWEPCSVCGSGGGQCCPDSPQCGSCGIDLDRDTGLCWMCDEVPFAAHVHAHWLWTARIFFKPAPRLPRVGDHLPLVPVCTCSAAQLEHVGCACGFEDWCQHYADDPAAAHRLYTSGVGPVPLGTLQCTECARFGAQCCPPRPLASTRAIVGHGIGHDLDDQLPF